jgi:hypothetical protein
MPFSCRGAAHSTNLEGGFMKRIFPDCLETKIVLSDSKQYINIIQENTEDGIQTISIPIEFIDQFLEQVDEFHGEVLSS